MPRKYILLYTPLLVAGLLAAHVVVAQRERLCFNVPGITNCIEGRFREYWEQNGGLPVFGYPISAATPQQTAEGNFLTQYFERNRFELHPEKARPYDVLLGRLGDDRLKQQGRDWQAFPKGQQTGGCLFFAETGHSVCDQAGNIGFKSYWNGHGLQDPALGQYQRSLALFGLPLSEPMMETNAAGATVLTQWFERARFEYHPNNADSYKVLLGLLGNETRVGPPGTSTTPTSMPPGQSAAPTATSPIPSPTTSRTAAPTTMPSPTSQPIPTPAPTQSAACRGVAPPVDAAIEPNCVRYGGRLRAHVYGFESDQDVSVVITDGQGTRVAPERIVRAGSEGGVTIEIDTSNYAGVQLRPGDYTLIARDVKGELRPSSAPFRVIP